MFNLFRKNDPIVGSAAYWKQRAENAERSLQRQIGFTSMASLEASTRKLELIKLQRACARKARQLHRVRGENKEIHRILANVDWSKQGDPFFSGVPLTVNEVDGDRIFSVAKGEVQEISVTTTVTGDPE